MHVSQARAQVGKPPAVALVVALVVLLLAAGGGFTLAAQADDHGGGANTSGPYDPSEPGPGDENQGKGNAPDNGSVGKADDKNPPGQVGKAGDRGYECDDNSGVGDKGGNPAHTGCRDDGGNGVVGGVEDVDEGRDVDVTAPWRKAEPAAAPTVVDAGLGGPTAPMSYEGSYEGSYESALGQGLLATGVLMLLLAGTSVWGRRPRGADHA